MDKMQKCKEAFHWQIVTDRTQTHIKAKVIYLSQMSQLVTKY